LEKEEEHRIPNFTQNLRMVGVARDLWRSSSPTTLLKQFHLEQVAQDLVQVGFEYLQRRRLHNPSGQPVPVHCRPQCKAVLPLVQMELLMLQFRNISFRNISFQFRNIYNCSIYLH